MKLIFVSIYFLTLLIVIGAPPVVPESKTDSNNPKSNENDASDDVLTDLEYGRYLKEVVEILETDPEFKKKIENASIDDIKSGNVAEHLSLVQHQIRSKLDEAKQREMSRLSELVVQKLQNMNSRQRSALARSDPDSDQLKELLPQHVDHKNAATFGQLDLERLIQQASKDLDALDRKRRKQFKEYEMRKEYQRRQKLSKLTPEQREKLEKLHQEVLEQKKHHPKVNHPGSVDQMEEVWEKVDKLEAEQFKPKAFFQLHDVNGDGFLDEGELRAIMYKEAAKIHDGGPDPDPVERQEEIDRMREHVMREFDKDNDRMVSYEEFEIGMNGTGARNEQGWQSIEDNTVFSDQEFQNFSRKMMPMSTRIPDHQTPTPTPTPVPVHPQVSNEQQQQPAAPQPPPQGQPEAEKEKQAAPPVPPPAQQVPANAPSHDQPMAPVPEHRN